MSLRFEEPIDSGLAYRPTLIGRKGQYSVLVEAQENPSITPMVREACQWVMGQRMNGRFYIATHENANISGILIAEFKKLGLGLLFVGTAGTDKVIEAKNWAYVVSPDPELSLGGRKRDIEDALEKYNSGNRKDGLRDLCDIVEAETKALLLTAIGRNIMTVPKKAAESMDWEGRINALASPNSHANGEPPVVSPDFKHDLLSFKGARNLVGHPVDSWRLDKRRSLQYQERMTQGPRLVAELIHLDRKLRRRR